MKKITTYSSEVRERAVRMVLEHLIYYPSKCAVIEAKGDCRRRQDERVA